MIKRFPAVHIDIHDFGATPGVILRLEQAFESEIWWLFFKALAKQNFIETECEKRAKADYWMNKAFVEY